MKQLLTLIFLVPILSFAGKIDGFAAEHVGKTVRIIRFDEYITKRTIEVANSIVKEDSTFTLVYEDQGTFEAIIEIGDVFGYMYLQDSAEYKIGVPLLEPGQIGHRANIQLAFTELPPENDINFLILDLDYRIDGFIGNTYDIIASDEWSKRMMNFKKHLADLYKDEKDPYFLTYLSYSIAHLELIGHPKIASNVKQELIYETYLKDAPVFERNNAYMMLINDFYKNVFGSIEAFHERSLMKAFVTEEIDSIRAILYQHAYYSNPVITELVMIKGMGEVYMNGKYPRTNVLNMLKTLADSAKTKNARITAANMIKKLTKLMRGYPAPNFSLKDSKGNTRTLTDFKGKYIYLTFFEDWSVDAVNELKILSTMQDKYVDYIEFVSICMGPKEETLDNFLKEHKDFQWTFLNGFGDADLKEYYEVLSVPLYYMIDDEGNIFQAPAKPPSPGGAEYTSIEKTMYQITKMIKSREEQRPDRNSPFH